MKNRKQQFSLRQILGASTHGLLGAGLAICGALTAQASTLYWNGSDTRWAVTTAWSTDSGNTGPNPSAVPSSSDVATFNISTVNTAQTLTLDAAQSALGLVFNNTDTTTIDPGTSGTLTTGIGGITVASGAGAVTLYAPITLGAGPQTWTNSSASAFTINDSAGALTRTGNATLNFNKVGAGNFTMSTTVLPMTNDIIGSWAIFGAANTSQVYAQISGGVVSGITYSATPTGLQGLQTYGNLGLITDTTGTVNYDTGNSGQSGAMASNASFNTLRFRNANNYAGNFTTNGLLNATNAGSTVTLTGAITIGANNELVVVTSRSNTITNFNGSILESLSSASALTIDGLGTVNLNNNASTFTGNVTINGGTVTNYGNGINYANNTSALGSTSATGRLITVNSGATLHLSGNGIVVSGPAIVLNSGATLTAPTNYRPGIGSVLQFNGGSFLTGDGVVRNEQINSPTAVINTVNDCPQLTADINVLTGTSTIAPVSGAGGLGIAQSYGTARTFNVASGAVLMVSARLGASWDGGGVGLTKTGGGVMILANNNIYDGTTTISGGTLQIGDGTTGSFGGFIYDATKSAYYPSGYVPLAVTSGFSIGASGTLAINLPADGVLSPNITNDGALTVIGGNTNTLSGVISGAGSLSQSGVGTIILNGNNSYTGATTVSAGKLFVNGNSISASGDVSVNASATLGGTGTLGANTTLAANGKLEFTLSTAADSHDKLELAATKTLTFTGASTLTITSSGGASPGLYTLMTAPGGISGSAPTVSLPLGWTSDPAAISGKDLVLNITSINADPYALWSDSAAFGADTNGDGVLNGLAWLLGATDKNVSALDKLPIVTRNGGNLILNFTCLKVAHRGTAALKLQYSKDLGISDLWTGHEVSVPDSAGLVGAVNFTVPSVNPDPNLVNLEATIPVSEASPGTKLFARLMGQP